MSFSVEEVRKVAGLAQLALDDQQCQELSTELAAIAAYVEQLSSVDVSNVEPVAQVTGLVSVLRPDVVGAMLPREEALAAAPAHNDRAILVPKAVER